MHDVTWAMFWGGSRSTKSCVFPYKVAAGDDERYLVCAAVAAGVGLLFFCRIVTVASSCFGCACVCVVIGYFGICACRSHWNGCMTLVIWCSGVVLCVDRCRFATWCCEPHCDGYMMLHGKCFGEEVEARNLVFFPCKVAAGDDERYLVCAAVAAGVGLLFFFAAL